MSTGSVPGGCEFKVGLTHTITRLITDKAVLTCVFGGLSLVLSLAELCYKMKPLGKEWRI